MFLRLAFGIFSILSILATTDAAVAQVSTAESDTVSYSTSTIYLQHSLFGAKYVRGGESKSAGGSYGNLKEQLVDVPKSYELASRGAKIVTHGRIVSLLGALLGATTFFVHGEVAEIGVSMTGFIVAGVGGAIQMKGKNRVDKAVWIYNEEMTSRSNQSSAVRSDYGARVIKP